MLTRGKIGIRKRDDRIPRASNTTYVHHAHDFPLHKPYESTRKNIPKISMSKPATPKRVLRSRGIVISTLSSIQGITVMAIPLSTITKPHINPRIAIIERPRGLLIPMLSRNCIKISRKRA
jgi:hypothetical protein